MKSLVVSAKDTEIFELLYKRITELKSQEIRKRAQNSSTEQSAKTEWIAKALNATATIQILYLRTMHDYNGKAGFLFGATTATGI
jgi:23S rRNA maturation mini-RNase III